MSAALPAAFLEKPSSKGGDGSRAETKAINAKNFKNFQLE